MTKTKKKLLGLLGLFLVAATTTFAALIPLPEAEAVTINNTDTISVRVVGNVPKVEFTGIESGTTFREPSVQFGLNNENVTKVKVEVEYTDQQGHKHTYTIDEFDDDYEPGHRDYTLDLTEDRFGPGHYTLRVTGNGYGAENLDNDVVEFDYGTASATEGEDGEVVIDPGHIPDNVTRLEVNVYNEAGELVEAFSPTNLSKPFAPFTLDFAGNQLPNGDYTVVVTEYENDEKVGEYSFVVHYQAPEIPVPEAGGTEKVDAPDTGSFFQNLNISRTDYLVTGLLIFITAAAIGAYLVIRKRGQKATAKKRH